MDARTAAEPSGPGPPWISRPLFRFDAWLRRRNRVFEYTAHPQCIFRMQVVALGHEVALADGTRLRPGDRIIDLHIWNEQFPRFPADGATLSWALKIRSRVAISLAQLARYLPTCGVLESPALARIDQPAAPRITPEHPSTRDPHQILATIDTMIDNLSCISSAEQRQT